MSLMVDVWRDDDLLKPKVREEKLRDVLVLMSSHESALLGNSSHDAAAAAQH